MKVLRWVLVLTVAAYLPLWWNGFVYEDADVLGTVASPMAHLGRGLLGTLVSRVVTDVTFFANHAVGAGPRGYHLTTLAFHLVNVVLVWHVVRLAFESDRAGVIAAAVFALHPIQAEAVSYLTIRGDVVGTLFVLLAMWFALARVWECVPVFLWLGMHAKEDAVVGIPLVALLLTFTRVLPISVASDLRRWWGTWAWLCLGLLVMTAAVIWIGVETMGWVPTLAAQQTAADMPTWMYLGQQALALIRAGLVIVVPVLPTTLDPYVQQFVDSTAVFGVVVVGVSVLALMMGMPVVLLDVMEDRASTRSYVWFGAMWVAICVAPRFMLRLSQPILDHHLYLAMVGVSAIVGVLWVKQEGAR